LGRSIIEALHKLPSSELTVERFDVTYNAVGKKYSVISDSICKNIGFKIDNRHNPSMCLLLLAALMPVCR
jgi:hypothetical protein